MKMITMDLQRVAEERRDRIAELFFETKIEGKDSRLEGEKERRSEKERRREREEGERNGRDEEEDEEEGQKTKKR